MNNDDESVDINYKKGFNHGYWLADDGKPYLDELLKGITNKETSYYKALLAGKKQREKEKFLSQIKDSSQEKDRQKDE
jgi:hypothetical protein